LDFPPDPAVDSAPAAAPPVEAPPAVDPALAFRVLIPEAGSGATGLEPVLGGALRQKAVWVDEAVCIGCRYCAHVACNTFLVEPTWGRSRAIRQNGDSGDRIQEAIDTCPVDCIHWVDYEQLPALEAQLDQQEILPLGVPSPARLKRTLPRATASIAGLAIQHP